ncbi:hypothetical protein [Pareuzebyella sediminis]|uniref:hypothetical protein n=1 Tax=Pareuzebyella sediminis TaxID=2607998 RepID=UPI0011EF47BE|nr:hypothetical protein [Pareuzebyella sediminis]
MRKLAIIVLLTIIGCTSTEMVENYKNPDIVIFYASKVLLVGMAQNEGVRVDFETNLKKEFDARNVEAMRSIDLFDVDFTNYRRTEKELDDVEQSLLDKDFDAILLTKIVGSESRQSFRKTLAELNKYGDGFKEDYQRHQDIYYDDDYYDKHTVYNAETSLYCICEGKERSLIWRGSIEINNPNNVEKTIEDYVQLVVAAMEAQDLVFYKSEDEG